MHIFHKWTKWADVVSSHLTADWAEGGVLGYYIKQERRCEICNKLEIRIQREMI